MLAPSGSAGAPAGARLLRGAARVLAGPHACARAIADFIVATLARNRAQQTPFAMNVAIGAAMVVIELTRRGSDFAGLHHPSLALSRLPLLLAYWLAIGLRASFFVPSELPAAWTFRTHATEAVQCAHCAIRGVAAALLVPPVTLLASVLAALVGSWSDALWHTIVAALAVLLLVEVVALTVPFIPFARPYEAGHAKLKTRWPFYAIGVYVFAYALVRLEEAAWHDSRSFGLLLASLAAAICTMDVIGEMNARRRAAEPLQEVSVDEWRIAVLDLAGIVPRGRAES